MIKNAAIKAMAAMMAVWAAWSLGNLARELSVESARVQALDEAIAEIQVELTQLETSQDDIPALARKMGYIHRGDIVFFDGG